MEMETLEPYFERFSESGRRVLEGSLNESQQRNQFLVSPEHILFAVINEEPEFFDATMREHSIDPQEVRVAVEKRLENSRTHTGKGFRIAPETTEIFKYSMDKARAANRRTIEAKDICYILATYKYNLVEDILKNPENSFSAFRKNNR
jgi:ATP-dependent Clp protease ATP-binding subunit ClpA